MFSRFLRRKEPKTRVGLAENERLRCIVWHEYDQQYIRWQKLPVPLNLRQYKVKGWQNATVIRPLPEQYIWEKRTVLPLISESELYKQIIDMFKQEMPIELSEVYFDYQVTRNFEQNTAKVALHAVRKSYVDSIKREHETILDSEWHCLKRALINLQPELAEQEEIDVYAELDKIEKSALPPTILDKSLYIVALGASLWNGKE